MAVLSICVTVNKPDPRKRDRDTIGSAKGLAYRAVAKPVDGISKLESSGQVARVGSFHHSRMTCMCWV